ncbi:MAG: sulfatase-like hydrolase/transferase, partial [Planctomycetes bacterium]|nr:sulfatase-like hydrolase/transferase [Planctomycetota bacterium]
MDDLNDLPFSPIGKPLVATPNMDRLAAKGIAFTNAHTNDPICAPSRACLLSGLYPQTTGMFWFESLNSRSIYGKSTLLPNHMMNNGFKVYGTGKIFHGGTHKNSFNEYGVTTNFGPHPVNGLDAYMGHHSDQDSLFDEFEHLPYKWEQSFGILEKAPDWSHLAKGKKGWIQYGKPWK